MRKLALLAAVGAAACSRSFKPPVASGPHIEALDDHGGVFAGETVTLHGSGFSPQRSGNQVSVAWPSGVVSAVVLDDLQAGSPSESTLVVSVPNLGAPTAANVAVTVEGRTSNAASLAFRGAGHPVELKLATSADLSPTLTSASVFRGTAAVTLLRNRVVALASPGFSVPATFPLGADPTLLPFASALLPAPPTAGGPDAVAIWLGIFDVSSGPSQRLFEAQGSDVFSFAFQPWTAGSLPFSPVAAGQDGLHQYVPTVDGKVVSYLAGVEAAALGQRADAIVRDPHGGLITSASALVPLSTDDGGLSLATFEAALLFDPASGGLSLDEVSSPDAGAPVTLPVLEADSGEPVPFAAIHVTALAVAPSETAGALPTQAFAIATGPGGATELLALDLITGRASLQALPFEADALVVTQSHGENYLALSSVFAPVLYIYPAGDTSTLRAVVDLPGLPFTLTRDEAGGALGAVYAVIASPPELVAVDPQTATEVSRTPFNSEIRVAAMNRDGTALAVAASRLPALAIVDGETLQEDGAGFQHAAGFGAPETTAAGVGAFRLTPDGGEELCMELAAFSPDGGALPSLRCGPPDGLMAGQRSCELLSADDLSAGLNQLAAPSLVAMPDGRLLVFGGKRRWSCAPGCSGCTPAGDDYPAMTLVTGSAAGDVFGRTAGGLVEVDASGAPHPLCAIADAHCADDTAKTLAVDPRGALLSALGQGPVLYDLVSGNLPQRIPYFSDIPTAQAFSPDGRRLYVGTVLGHLDEYDVSTWQQPFPQVRTLFAGFPITQILAYPDGSRLLLGELNTDRLHVVQ